MTILNESGMPDVLSPLHAAGALADRLGGALVVVVGTRAEANLAQSFPDAPSPLMARRARNPRLVFAVLDPDESRGQGRLASRVIEAAAGFRGIETVVLVAGHTARALGVDAPFEARLISRRLDLPAVAVDHDAPYDAPGVLSTDLEDRATAALVTHCPKEGTSDLLELEAETPKRVAARVGGRIGGLLGRGGREERRAGRMRTVVLAGAFRSPQSAREVAGELARVGVHVAGCLPASRVGRLPALSEGGILALMDPGLAATARAAEDRGAEVVRTLAPVGVDGTARFLQDVARAAGTGATELGRARATWGELETLRNRVRGKRIFFAGDTGFELPLARFLADAGAVVLEVGTPRLDRWALSQEIHALGPDVDVVEAPDTLGQMDRIETARPDVVVASPGLHAVLVSRGYLCRSPWDFVRANPYGYGGARRILELLVGTFERAEALDSFEL